MFSVVTILIGVMIMPLTEKITNFSPYLKDGVLDLNQEGNKFSSGKGGNRCFEKIFDIGRLALNL